MMEIASIIVINLIIACIIGGIMGYMIGKSSDTLFQKKVKTDDSDLKKVKVNSKTNVNPIFRKGASLDFKPLILTTPRQSGKDNFLKIKGIDQGVETELNKLGIYHFDQISKWSQKNCHWVEEILNLNGQIRKERWVEQAKIFAEGNETQYSLSLSDEDKKNEETKVEEKVESTKEEKEAKVNDLNERLKELRKEEEASKENNTGKKKKHGPVPNEKIISYDNIGEMVEVREKEDAIKAEEKAKEDAKRKEILKTKEEKENALKPETKEIVEEKIEDKKVEFPEVKINNEIQKEQKNEDKKDSLFDY